jgi:hypothetical protein
LGDFFALFLADRAPLGWDSYQALMKETDVTMGTWEREASDGDHGHSRGVAMHRRLEFTKPVNTFGIESTRASKSTAMTVFPDIGLVLTSVTLLDPKSAVPLATLFGVHDSLIVRALSSDSIAVSLYYEMRWHQSSMLTYFVETETRRATLPYLSGYIAYVRDYAERRLDTTEEGVDESLQQPTTPDLLLKAAQETGVAADTKVTAPLSMSSLSAVLVSVLLLVLTACVAISFLIPAANIRLLS